MRVELSRFVEGDLDAIADYIALLPENSTAIMDADFAKDVEAAIESHHEPLEPSAWD